MNKEPDPYQKGDVLQVNVGVTHYGIYVGNGHVIHNSKQRSCITKETLKTFSGGGEIALSHEIVPENREETVEYAESHLEDDYYLFSNNCEHFARAACGKLKESKQLQDAVAAVVILALIILLISSSSEESNKDDKT
ncbi:lecithin retinol acyltransferase family protein [Candidatus Haliotispira prima]|uniref:Lecithin retinol acyltransferase family protein n=1 Tax=Candidatus Haliotispira prima TaxID=3034016 RepID=A0ABY8MJ35_9SPIO|nr:lecithin retinol acyltransferase family protein [Candidatus Haliotispira prima]